MSIFLAVIIDKLDKKADQKPAENGKKAKSKTSQGLKLMWITPLRSLAKDLARAMREVCTELELDWIVADEKHVKALSPKKMDVLRDL